MRSDMASPSELVGREVRAHRGNMLGKLTDLLIHSKERRDYPRIAALGLTPNGESEPAFIAWTADEDSAGNKIILQHLHRVHRPERRDYSAVDPADD
jgi:hypothetical protein